MIGDENPNCYRESESRVTSMEYSYILLAPSVVHYLWCGDKKFRLKDYLGVLSAMKIFRPFKLVFHFSHLPQTDDYNVWFKEMTSTIPELELKNLSTGASCGSPDNLNTALGFLSKDGGVFVGEGIVLSPFVKERPVNTHLWSAFSDTPDKTSGVIIATKGFDGMQRKAYFEKIIATSTKTQPRCTSVDEFTLTAHDSYCVSVSGIVYPRDIMDANTSFAELARFLFYGRREPIVPVQDASNPIPRISHFLRFKSGKGHYGREFPFHQFLSVLSALHVAGFRRVYLHADEEPSGRWWKELAGENVTLVKMDPPRSVFQQSIRVLQHASDIARYQILYKYGGAYQDFDVTWTSFVPDSLLSYPFVGSMDWVVTDNWPESFNLGVSLAKPRAKWLRYHLQTHKDFRDSSWGYNALLMSYRTYERHPDLMYLDRHLMVLCFREVCHPSWDRSYLRIDINDRSRTLTFRWQDEARSIHVTVPKPHPSMSSPAKAKQGQDMYAEIARFVLKKSGRHDLLA
ncbi:hypothetical protein ACOMHN_010339 [Nucella lapillus]